MCHTSDRKGVQTPLRVSRYAHFFTPSFEQEGIPLAIAHLSYFFPGGRSYGNQLHHGGACWQHSQGRFGLEGPDAVLFAFSY